MNFCLKKLLMLFQAPFYPLEAEKKGCVPSEYGLVFGIFELTVFLVSPLIGANLNRMGLKATLTIGIGTVGVTSICFGFLDRIEDGKTFLALSFTFRYQKTNILINHQIQAKNLFCRAPLHIFSILNTVFK
jgi:MFS family permease